MATIEQSIDVEVPVRTAYDQWTQFEQFPQFMEGVEEVRQSGDTHTHWRTKVAGKEKEFDAVITEQTPDQRIAWTSEDGPEHAGVVTFHRLDEAKTRVMLQMDYEPEGVAEKIGDALGLVERRVKGDLCASRSSSSRAAPRAAAGGARWTRRRRTDPARDARDMRLGFAVKVLGAGGLPSHDTRRWQSEPHLRVSLDHLEADPAATWTTTASRCTAWPPGWRRTRRTPS